MTEPFPFPPSWIKNGRCANGHIITAVTGWKMSGRQYRCKECLSTQDREYNRKKNHFQTRYWSCRLECGHVMLYDPPPRKRDMVWCTRCGTHRVYVSKVPYKNPIPLQG